MSRAFQAATLRKNATVQGIGLFTGLDATLTIRSAPAHTGLVFKRTDLNIEIPATIDHLSAQPVHPAFANASSRNTSLALDPADPHSPSVLTTEHALGALVGLGITDAILEVNAPELPIDDGSARDITRAILEAGIKRFDQTCNPICPTKPLRIGDEHTYIEITPADHPEYHYRIDYGDPAPFPAHTAEWLGGPDEFARDIAPARTFSLDREVTPLRAAGMFARFEPSELLVLGPDGPIENDWRHPNEPARHKLLDLMGDLALSGTPIVAKVVACRSGHSMNHAMARMLQALR